MGQGPCDQYCESCLGCGNSFGPNYYDCQPPARIDKDHGQQFYTVTLQP